MIRRWLVLTGLLVLVGLVQSAHAKEDYADPVLKTLRTEIGKAFAGDDAPPAFEVPGSSGGRILQVRYRTRDYTVHPREKDGCISKHLARREGPGDDGILLTAQIQYLGRANQAKTPQTIQQPYWSEFLEVYRIEKAYKQIYFTLAYNTRTKPEAIERLKAIAKRVCLERNQHAVKQAVPGKLTAGEVGARVRAGALGGERAKRARQTDPLWMHEIQQDVVPLQLFYYSDYREGINLLVEDGKLIRLSAAWGSGPVTDLKVVAEGDRKLLRYTYTMGSGIQHPMSAEYELGSGAGGGPALFRDDPPR